MLSKMPHLSWELGRCGFSMGGMSTTENLPIVYFLSANNVEKSAMAEAITNARHGHLFKAYSAGTDCEKGLSRDADCVAACAEIGITLDGVSTPVDEDLFEKADFVIVVSRKMTVDPVPDMKGVILRWGVDEPSEQGITGRERANLLRDYLIRRVDALAVGAMTSDGTLRSGYRGEDILDQTGGEKSSRRLTGVK